MEKNKSLHSAAHNRAPVSIFEQLAVLSGTLDLLAGKYITSEDFFIFIF